MAEILNSKPFIQKLSEELSFKRRKLDKVCLAAVKVDRNDASSDVYISSQRRLAEKLGVEYRLYEFAGEEKSDRAVDLISALNGDDTVTGVIIHKPLPRAWDEFSLLNRLSPGKDIEGITPHNLGRILLNNPRFIPPTVRGILEVLRIAGVSFYGREVVIVGFSSHIGKPLSVILADRFATVRITHVATYERENLPVHVKSAEVIVSGVGKPDLIKGEWIKKGAVVIDVGISRVGNSIRGDVDFEGAKAKAAFITPVPGGVGPFTSLFLFDNLFKAAGHIK